jgi:hypothetical protein
MINATRALWLAATSLLGVTVTSVANAQPAPSTTHPRIWLDASTRNGLQAQATAKAGPVARAMARCVAAQETPDEYSQGGWQGFEFVTTLSSCLTAYVAAGRPVDLTTAIKYWRVLLDDYQQVGDGKGGDDVVTHDTGYAMRTFAPYSALAYDWLHDAPGVTEELRAHARARFDAWSTYYSTQGYLRDVVGANYHAGYVFAATLMAVAEAGEAGEAGERHWVNVRDVIWKRDMAPALAPGGVLDGGDWPEGWQYGSLSVLELSLAARALQENGLNVPGAVEWSSSLPLRFAHALTPASRASFTGGDSDASTPHREPANGALLAAIVGPASDGAKALARALNTQLGLSNENPLFDALAAAQAGTLTALQPSSATSYLSRGAGNWYVRGDWTSAAAWGVFQCSHQLVNDHQYPNAGNWVLSRGADDLVVDPSPYGSLSTLTGNAPAIDSGSLPDGYSPSQGFWGKRTGWVWTRQSDSGLAAGRCEYADQFQRSDVPSDVKSALRDFVMLPESDGAIVVLVDRASTAGAERALHLRVRTPVALTLQGDRAYGTSAGSSLSIDRLWSSSGAPTTRVMPRAEECPSSSHTCDISKLPSGSEYRIDVAGGSAFAIHVVSARAGVAAQNAKLLAGSGFKGALLERVGGNVAVITSDAGTPAAALSYGVPAANGARHVVLDAPVNAAGESDVVAVREGSDCKVQVVPHVGVGPGLPGRPLIVAVQSDCSVRDDGLMPPATSDLDPTSGGASAGHGGSGSTGAGTANLGAPLGPSASTPNAEGCSLGRAAGGGLTGPAWAVSVLLGLARLGQARRRRHG